MAPEARYGVEELAGLAGVSRRTVRYYVQKGLLPPPFGLGRGRHYGPPHLETLVRLKTLQERGLTLAAIRERLARTDARVADSRPAAAPPRSAWTRLEVLPGIELNVSSAWRLPPPERLRELAAWCRQNFPPEEETDA